MKFLIENKVSILAIAIATVALPAHAQVAPPSPTEIGAPSTPAVEAGAEAPTTANQEETADIVVTAQHRAERLQDIPASITAVSAAQLTNSGFTNPADIQYLAPTVTFNPQQGAGFQIRGIGSQGFDYSLEKSVSTVVDDVVQGLPRALGIATLADVERIEVLRGPQGTLFGKNASGGVVYVVTRKPQFDKTEVIGHYRYGSGNELQLQNVINVPITETFAARASVVYNRRDGIVRNTFLNKDLAGYSDFQATGKLLWRPTDRLELYVIGDYLRHRDGGLGAIQTLRSVAPFTGQANTQNILPLISPYGVVPGPRNEQIALEGGVFAKYNTKSVTGTITYDLGDGLTLMSISGYKRLRLFQQLDADQSPNNFFSVNAAPDMTARQTTQEFRLTSPTGGFLDYTLGLYYYHQAVDSKETQYGTFGRTNLPPNTFVSFVGADAFYTVRSTSYAAFGQANLHFTDRLTGVVGLRYTHDRVRGTYAPLVDPVVTLIPQTRLFPAAGDTVRAGNVSGRATLQYQFTPTIMGFATYSRGYKAPAVGTIRGVVRPVEAEKSNNYEVGLKTELFDRLLTFNLTGFITKFKNFQTQTLAQNSDGSLTFVLANAEGLKSYGIEAEARLRVSRAFSLSFGGAWAPSEYTGFLSSCYAGQTLNAQPGPGCYLQGTTRVFDVSGTPLIQAPKWTSSVSADYGLELNSGYELRTNAVYSYRSKVYSVAGNPNTIVGGYGIVNGTIGYGPSDGRWKIGLYTRNLFDKHYVGRIQLTNYVPAGSYAQTPVIDSRRTVGVSADFAF